MSTKPIAPEQLSNLRHRATSRLSAGAGATRAPVSASNALAVLHDLASSPETAADALALLHELQVHQVELDLQADELRESRAGLETALRRQTDLYDCQPVACFTIDGSTAVHELNRCAARMLGVGRDEACGLPLNGFLSSDSGRILREQISSIAQGNACEASTLQLIPKDGTGRRVRAHIGADPAGQRFLVVLASADEDRARSVD
jgi:PAS domain S-box-containing protein